MKLMLTIAHEFLAANKQATIQQIFDEIREQQKVYWKETFPNKMLSKIEVQKMGELFTYLTTDGRFVMVDANNWALAENFPYEEVKRMRLNIGTKHD